MDKGQMAEQVQKEAGLSAKQAAALVESMLALLKSTLQNGEDISISGFGNFRVRSKRARQGRNPRTGEPVTIEARRVVTFRPSALLKTYLNGQSVSG
jgi:integration host factor subunit alpha